MSVSSYESSLRQPLDAKARPIDRAARLDAARRLLTGIASRDGDPTKLVHPIVTLGPAWLRQHGLAPLAWVTWRNTLDLPIELSANFHRAYYVAVGDAELHRLELGRVLGALAAQGITPVVFKGAVLRALACPISVRSRGLLRPTGSLRTRILRLRYAPLTPCPTHCVGGAPGGMLTCPARWPAPPLCAGLRGRHDGLNSTNSRDASSYPAHRAGDALGERAACSPVESRKRRGPRMNETLAK